jgi:hypothetical protein
MGVSRREIRDIWRAVAKAFERDGDHEQARRARETARLWDDGQVRNWRGEVVTGGVRR